MSQFDAEKYEAACREWAEGSQALDLWRVLGEALSNHSGWRFEMGNFFPSPPFGWCFGPSGSAHLVVTASDAGFILYMADTDTDRTIATLAELLKWLDANEVKYAKLSPAEIALQKAAEAGADTDEEDA